MEAWKRFSENSNEPKQLTAQAIRDSKVPNQIDRAVELALSRISDAEKKKELAALFKQAHAFGHKLDYGKYKDGTYSLDISGFRVHPVTENEIRYVYFKQGSLSGQKSSDKLKVKPVTKTAANKQQTFLFLLFICFSQTSKNAFYLICVFLQIIIWYGE